MRGRSQIVIVSAVVLLLGGISSAQSLGDIARAERARRAGLEKHATVLTNEDLQREQIIVREAATPATVTAAEQPSQKADRVPAWSTAQQPEPLKIMQQAAEPAPVSLGEVARRYRALRDARRRAEAEALAARALQPAPASAPRVNVITIVQQSAPSPSPAPRDRRHESAPRVAAVPARENSQRHLARHERRSQTAEAVTASASGHLIVVHPGDSLWKISRHELGDGVLWTAIWKANPQIKNPNRIYPGQKLEQPNEEQIAAARGHRHVGIEMASLTGHSAQKRVTAIVVDQQFAGNALRTEVNTNRSGHVPHSQSCDASANSPIEEACKPDLSLSASIRGRR